MNEKSLHTLEFDKVTSRLAALSGSAAAKARARALRPSTDRTQILAAQRQTFDALSRILTQGSFRFFGICDITSSLRRLALFGTLSAKELLQISSLLTLCQRAKEYGDEKKSADGRRTEGGDTLSALFASLDPLFPLCSEIGRCILSEEEIADDASPELFRVRQKIGGMSERIHAQLDKLISQNETRESLQDTLVTMRDGRYCLPVKAEAKNQFSGIVHDQSKGGATYFIEPSSVVALNNELRQLKLEEEEEIERVLAALSARAGECASALKTDYSLLCELDFIFAKGMLAKEYRGSAPDFTEDGSIFLKGARHPLLDAASLVPIDVQIGEEFRQLVVTGPNTGGKTVSLKTVGLLTLMGQAGLLIPADPGSKLSVFTEVFADIGDEQSIEQSLSTFSSHMKNLVQILDLANKRSLVLLDELCSGTDPTEGAALAEAILRRLLKSGSVVMASTHYSELKVYAMTTPGAQNASVEFDVQTLSPTYRLLIGIPGKSNAFAISEKLGLKESILSDAKSRVGRQEADFESLIAQLQDGRQKMQQAQEQLRADQARMEEEKEKLRQKSSRLEQSRDRILAEANEEALSVLRKAKETADASIKAIQKYGSAPGAARKAEEERTRLREEVQKKEADAARSKKEKAPVDAARPNPPKSVRPGDLVRVLSMHAEGTVLTSPDAKGVITVQMGILRMQVPLSDLKLLSEKSKRLVRERGGDGTSSIKESKSSSVSPELKLLGKTTDEALMLLDKYLDDATLAHLPSVRIVHGKGTGALRKAVQNALRRDPRVSSFRLGEFGEGDSGVTIAQLRS